MWQLELGVLVVLQQPLGCQQRLHKVTLSVSHLGLKPQACMMSGKLQAGAGSSSACGAAASAII